MSKKDFPLKIFPPLFIIVLIFGVFLSFQLAYLNRIYPGVSVAGIKIGNKSKSEAKNILAQKIKDSAPFKIVFKGPDSKTWEKNLSDLGFAYKIDETVNTAYQIGRQNNPLISLREQGKAWLKGTDLPFLYQINEKTTDNMINEISQSLFIPIINPQINISGKEIVIDPGKVGQEVDRRTIMAAVSQQLSSLKNDPINISLIQTNPQLTNDEIETTKKRAQKLLGKSLSLTFEDQAFAVPDKDLIDFLSFNSGFDSVKVSDYVKNLSSTINRPAQNAAFQFSDGKVTMFKPAKEGIVLKEKETFQDILIGLDSLENAAENKKTVAIQLKVDKSSPQIQTGDVNNLGIKTLLGKGVSHFAGSIPSRIHNIILAASRVNGTLVPSGETFSFNQALGEVSQATGFQEAYIIQNGRTVLGDGGGVCQVSTTLFRAILKAGLPVEERHAHAYRVSYYEQQSSVGLDATVFAPSVDFKFKNDTPANILIQTAVDTKNATLIFELYGTSDGRIATISQSKIWDQVPPPPDLYQDDPTLPAGQVKQVDWKAWGAKAAFDYKVIRGAEVLQQRTFYSAYRPWQAIFLRSTQ